MWREKKENRWSGISHVIHIPLTDNFNKGSQVKENSAFISRVFPLRRMTTVHDSGVEEEDTGCLEALLTTRTALNSHNNPIKLVVYYLHCTDTKMKIKKKKKVN